MFYPTLEENSPASGRGDAPKGLTEIPTREILKKKIPTIETRKKFKKYFKKNANDTRILEINEDAILESIKQVYQISMRLCCENSIPDFENFKKIHASKIKCDILGEWDEEYGGKKVILTAKNVLGRKFLASIYKRTLTKTLFFIKLNEGEKIKHVLSQPECLNPPNYMPLYFSPSMKICEKCRKTGCTKYCVCKDVMYCSKKCQKEDWRSHKQYCGK